MTSKQEWNNTSKAGLVCSTLECDIPPTIQCSKCFKHFCYDHIKSHIHILTKEEVNTYDKEKETEK